jgi:hypothetical protein
MPKELLHWQAYFTCGCVGVSFSRSINKLDRIGTWMEDRLDRDMMVMHGGKMCDLGYKQKKVAAFTNIFNSSTDE